jgi:hypothetical protein
MTLSNVIVTVTLNEKSVIPVKFDATSRINVPSRLSPGLMGLKSAIPHLNENFPDGFIIVDGFHNQFDHDVSVFTIFSVSLFLMTALYLELEPGVNAPHSI